MIYNCHIHTFKDTDIPENYLPLGLVRLLARDSSFRIIARFLNNLNPFSDNDTFDRYVKFCETGRLGSQKAIFEKCKSAYNGEEAGFFVLSMDMAFMGAGKVPRAYGEQLKELADLIIDYPQITAFVHVDPRREGYYDIFRQCIDQWGFKGLKIYPPLGYFPYDDRMMPVYAYCQEKGIPVMAHCSPYNPVHFKGKYSDLYKLLEKSHHPIDVKGKSRKDLCANFTDPRNWLEITTKFPDLKICLAHFGSAYYWERYLKHPNDSNNWVNVICELIANNKNLFADISFTLYNEAFFPVLKKMMADERLRDKILFGSDYYMVETQNSESTFLTDLRRKIGEDDFRKMAFDNVERYLGVG